MAEIQNENDFLRKLSLSFFGKQVAISLKTDSNAFKQFGPFVYGKLTGRVWGDLETSNKDTVVALILMQSNNVEITIPCQDIVELAESSGENQPEIS